jgi:hypothetical protein
MLRWLIIDKSWYVMSVDPSMNVFSLALINAWIAFVIAGQSSVDAAENLMSQNNSENNLRRHAQLKLSPRCRDYVRPVRDVLQLMACLSRHDFDWRMQWKVEDRMLLGSEAMKTQAHMLDVYLPLYFAERTTGVLFVFNIFGVSSLQNRKQERRSKYVLYSILLLILSFFFFSFTHFPSW